MDFNELMQSLQKQESSQDLQSRLNSIENEIGSINTALNGLPDRVASIVNRAVSSATQPAPGSLKDKLTDRYGRPLNLGDNDATVGPSSDVNRAANEIRNYLNEFRAFGKDFINSELKRLTEEKERLTRVKGDSAEGSEQHQSATQELAIIEENSKSLERLANALPNLASRIDSSSEKSGKVLATMISQIASAIMLQQLMVMRNITLPYQYQTRPALSALGSSGMMGELLSGALGAQQSVMQGFREMAPGMGAGIGALAGFRLGGLPGMAIGGLVGSITATIPQVNEMLAGAIDFATGNFSQTAFQTSLGSALVDANKFKDITRAGLVPQLAFADTFSRNFAGNQVDFLQAGLSQGARAMGYGPMESAQFQSAVLTSLPLRSLNPQNLMFQTPEMQTFEDRDKASLSGLQNLSAVLESRGMSRESSLDLYSTLARAGSEDIIKSVSMMVNATSQDGIATDYTLNVLAPALSRVVESRAITNISRSSEEVERETAGIFSFIRTSGTRLADLIEKNPDAVLSQITGMIDQAGESALNDPARMMFLNQLGIPFMDVIGKNADVLYKPIEFFRGMASFGPEGRINREESLFTAMQMLNVLGIQMSGTNLQYAFELLEAGGNQERVQEVLKKIESDDPLKRIADAVEAFARTPTGNILTSITTQAEQYYTALTGNVTNILRMQQAIQEALGNNQTISNAITIAMSSFITKLAEMVRAAGDKDAADRILELITPLPTTTSTTETSENDSGAGESSENANIMPPSGGNVNSNVEGSVDINIGGGSNEQTSFATGGFTGLGGRLEPAGVVHGGEYVISDNRVPGNRMTLDRMMAGENLDEGGLNKNAEFGSENITVTLEFSNTNPQAIIDAALNSTRQMLRSERLV
jgi:hypothetical protein